MAQLKKVSELEDLLFKATNPANKLEDVNTIKKFCDTVAALDDGSALACRLLAHKIQSPQEREAVQALAVLEACVKAVGVPFHAEVGKFKFLNELIKLISPKYLGKTTPEHIKKKVIELLYRWTKDLKSEPKIAEAYEMLKKQGIVSEDPVYVGEAVFASSLPPRAQAPLNEDQSRLLKRLLQSKNPEDLEKANRIIKGVVREDERKMDELTRRHTELAIVNNNAKLLMEMLDHYNPTSTGPEEQELLKELLESCRKMQPKLFHMAAETDEGDESIQEILTASDELTKAMDRYKVLVILGATPAPSTAHASTSSSSSVASGAATAAATSRKPEVSLENELLNLDLMSNTSGERDSNSTTASLDDELLGASFSLPSTHSNHHTSQQPSQTEKPAPPPPSAQIVPAPAAATGVVIDLLSDSPTGTGSAPGLDIPSLIDSLANQRSTADEASAAAAGTGAQSKGKSSRQRGLEELDLLGESAIKSVLTNRSPHFAKKEKLPMSKLQEQKIQADLTLTNQMSAAQSTVNTPLMAATRQEEEQEKHRDVPLLEEVHLVQQKKPVPEPVPKPATATEAMPPKTEQINSIPKSPQPSSADVKLADLEVPLSSIQPSTTVRPVSLQDSANGLSIVLTFGRNSPREHVLSGVLTVTNRSSEAVEDLEVKLVVPKGCKVKLQTASASDLPPFNPFVPPPAITQVVLIANPARMRSFNLKYVLSYVQDGEPQTEMGSCTMGLPACEKT